MKIDIKTNNSIDTINVIQKKQCSIKKYDINIIIRTKNEANKISKCLKSVFNQKCSNNFIVTIIDSGSTDDTLKIVDNYDINIYSIAPESFNFGTSMQLGIILSKAKYTVFISGHAIPMKENWLQEMINSFDIEHVVAVYGKQTYTDDAYLIEKIGLDSAFGNTSKIQKWNKKFKKYSDYKNEILFSNANSCILTDIALKIPFSKLSASEDREWAMRVLQEGFLIKYNSNAVVLHFHNEDFKKYYKRILINSKALFEFANVEIFLFEIPIIILYKSLMDIKYAFQNKIKFNVFKVFHYRYLYVLAHYNGTRKEI